MEKIFEYINGIKERITTDTTASMSDFPNEIDPLLFIEDASLNTLEWRGNYDAILKEDVMNATEALSSNGNFIPVNAFLFNMLQDRIIETQKYLLTKEDTMVRVEFDEEPQELVNGKVWMLDKETFFSSISTEE